MLEILGRATSSNVQKLLWGAAELGLAFARGDIGGPFGGNDQAAYLALNPNGLVPTIVDDGFVLWESNACLRYLAAVHGAGGLWPIDARVRADAERWMDWQISTLSPSMVVVFRGLVRTPPERRDAAAIAAARDRLASLFGILDAALAERSFVAGEAFTVGDIPVGIAAYRWYHLDIERESYASLARWYDRLTERPGYREHVMKPLA